MMNESPHVTYNVLNDLEASEEAKFKTQLIELKELLIKFKLEEDDKLEGPQCRLFPL